MANPPYGVTWKKDQEFILNESLNPDGRFYAGTPRVSDGQLLFIQHMISKMELVGSDPKSLYMLNSELAGRTYNPPSLVLK